MLARKALAGTAGAPKEYVEDVFQTWFYAGNDSTNTITNGVDLSSKGGLVWIKSRTYGSTNHILFDTERGATKRIFTNLTDAQDTTSTSLTSFNSNGFTLGSNASENNAVETKYVSWTFRKAKKFFDIVTFTTSGSEPPNTGDISHNLGSTPGCVIVKSTSGSQDWKVYHRSTSSPTSTYLELNSTGAANSSGSAWINVSSTTISFPGSILDPGVTYVAYLFAHDAGGFGDAGSDSIIKCGSLTTDGSGNATVTLDWEPQWLLLKQSSTTGNWMMVDTMRGWNVQSSGNIQRLFSNLSNAESAGGQLNPTATGFKTSSGGLAASTTYVYIAIRRGPMKTPTSGTDVFAPIYANQSAGTKNTTNFPIDAMIIRSPSGGENNHLVSRLTGVSSDSTDSGYYLYTQSTAAEGFGGLTRGWDNTGFRSTSGYAGYDVIYLPFRRAPKFFDVVCYTGTGSARTVSHNLGVAPELIIVKNRSTAQNWPIYVSSFNDATSYIFLNSTDEKATGASSLWNSTSPTSSVFSVGTANSTNESGSDLIAYLFASLSGISKVGSYTGNGSSQTINCGFSAGARFVLVKRTDVAGGWPVFNSARGIVSGNDPYIQLNTTAAEVTDKDALDPDNSGFIVNETTGPNINVNGATYIYLAIA
jgi:hypothetical protein